MEMEVEDGSKDDSGEFLQQITSLYGAWQQRRHEGDGDVDQEFMQKMKAFLPRLVNEHLRPESDVIEVKLIVMLLEALSIEIPAVYWYSGTIIVDSIFFRLLPLLMDERYLSIAAELFSAIDALLALAQSKHVEVYRDFFSDLISLLEDLVLVLHHHLSEGSTTCTNAPVGSIVVVCFQKFADSIQAMRGEESGMHSQLWPSSTSEHAIDLSSVSTALLTLRSVTQLVHNQLARASLFIADKCHGLSKLLCEIILCAPTPTKICALNTLATLLSSVSAPSYRHEEVLGSLLQVLDTSDPLVRTAELDSSLARCFIGLDAVTPLRTSVAAVSVAELLPTNYDNTLSVDMKDWVCDTMARLATRCPSLYPFALRLLKTNVDQHRLHAIHTIAVILCDATPVRVKPKRRKLTEDDFCDISTGCPISAELERIARNEDGEKIGLRDSIRLLGSLVEIHIRMPDKYCADDGRKELISTIGHVLQNSESPMMRESLEASIVACLNLAKVIHYRAHLDVELNDLLRAVALTAHRSPVLGGEQLLVLHCLQISCWVRRSEEIIQFFLHCCSDKRLPVREAALRSLPLFCSGIREHSDVLGVLEQVGRLVGRAPESDQLLAEVIGRCACVAGHGCSLSLEKDISECTEDMRLQLLLTGLPSCPSVICTFCDEKTPPPEDRETIPIAVWRPFLQLLEGKSSSSRACLLRHSFGRLMWHCSYNDLRLERDRLVEFLDLAVDKNAAVRQGMVNAVACYFAEPHVARAFNKVAILQKLLDELHAHRSKREIQRDVLVAIGKIGCISKGDFLTVILLTLVDYFVHEDHQLRISSFECIKAIAASKGISIRRLVERPFSRRAKICCFLVDKLATSPMVNEAAASLFEIKSLKEWVKINIDITLPPLLVVKDGDSINSAEPGSAKSQGSIAVLDYLARLLGTSVKDLIMSKMACVLAHVCIHADDSTIEPSLQLVLNLCETRKLASLVEKHISAHIIQLVSRLHENPEKATRALKIIQKFDETGHHLVSTQDDSAGDMDSLSEFLQHHFLEVIHHTNHQYLKLRSAELCVHMVKSFRTLMELLGRHLTTFRPKVLATLKLFSSSRDAVSRTGRIQEDEEEDVEQLLVESCKAWLTFIRLLDLDTLGPLLTQIVAELAPFFEREQAFPILCEIYDFLMAHIQKLRPYIQKIPASCFPKSENDSVTRIRSVLRGSPDDQLSHLIAGIGHKSVNARKRSLEQLIQFLRIHKSFIHEMVKDNSKGVERVSELLEELLRCCTSASDEGTILLLANCLGELGAVDPASLDMDLRVDVPRKASTLELALEVIELYLVADLTATSSTLDGQNKVGYALQELLAFCGCRAYKNKAETGTYALKPHPKANGKLSWEDMDVEQQELIQPFIFSRYELKPKENASKPAGQISMYKAASASSKHTYEKWITAWAQALVPLTSGKNKEIFQACRGPLKQNVPLARHLLPYIVWDLLKPKDGELAIRKELLKEFVAVLEGGSHVAASPSKGAGESSAVSQQCTQAIFSIIDTLAKWKDNRISANIKKLRAGKGSKTVSRSRSEKKYVNVMWLLKNIPQKLLADSSYRCKAFTRALVHYENHIRTMEKTSSRPTVLRLTLDDLEKTYHGLDDGDGLRGLSVIRAHLMGRHYVSESVNAGEWTAAFTCLEQSLQSNGQHFEFQVARLKCLKQLGHLETMLSLVLASLPATAAPTTFEKTDEAGKGRAILSAYGVQAAWRLRKWDAVDQLSAEQSSYGDFDFEVSLGRMLLQVTNLEHKPLLEELRRTRKEVMASLAAASMESYERAYPFLVRLHICREIEESYPLLVEHKQHALASLVVDWEARLSIVSQSVSVRQLMTQFHRVLYESLDHVEQVLPSCLEIAKQARKAGQYQVAESTLHRLRNLLEECNSEDVAVHLSDIQTELAKLRWQQGEQYEALHELRTLLRSHKDSQEKDEREEDFIKQQLLEGLWVEKTGQEPSYSIVQRYEKVVMQRPDWERSYVALGRYLDKVLQQIHANRISSTVSLRAAYEVQGEGQESVHIGYLSRVVRCYGTALLYGHKYIFQTLPRMLTLWFEEGALIKPRGQRSERKSRSRKDPLDRVKVELQKVNTLMLDFKERLPVYQWLTCFPQLVSRVGSCSEEIYAILEQIIFGVMLEYPHQAFWGIIAATKSSISLRKMRSKAIVDKAQTKLGREGDSLKAAAGVCSFFLKICNYSVSKETSLNLSTMREFSKQLKVTGKVLMPTQKALTVTLPGPGLSSKREDHNPFPEDSPYIRGFKSKLEIMASLQKPKKIVAEGSDGKSYTFLLKPKDDLRKDARLQEFNMVVNMLLNKNQDCRRRKLHIRTYGVVPLDETCGIIEWVHNTTSYRTAITRLMATSPDLYPKGVMPSHEARKIWNGNQGHKEKFAAMCKANPPVLHRWFATTFTDPSSWYNARLLFTQSTAVMSMVGHIVGLGDRHGENILLENETGGVVHIDLNCLFWKGLTFEWPERVPFRLTPHMVDAFGVTEYEGAFRQVSELALALLRNNRDTLLCVLEPLVFDPLVEATSKDGSSAERWTREKLNSISSLLQGQVGGISPISVAGHVQKLIEDSTSVNNLGFMYIGWTPWL